MVGICTFACSSRLSVISGAIAASSSSDRRSRGEVCIFPNPLLRFLHGTSSPPRSPPAVELQAPSRELAGRDLRPSAASPQLVSHDRVPARGALGGRAASPNNVGGRLALAVQLGTVAVQP